ncbi:MAG: subclass B1 metallo-beta-lactamase [Spirochaetales bacterium]|nr:subclass B1 metallo-beta-lactamase [Spirochaetales bacterium]
MKSILIFLWGLMVAPGAFSQQASPVRIAEDLHLRPLSENVWIHISDLDTSQWGPVSANGLALVTDGILVLIDTPWNDRQTESLVTWFRREYGIKDIQVIVCHYHQDNLGGLNWIHSQGIESFSLERTRDICAARNLPVPMNGLEKTHRFAFREIPVETYFPGEGHTVDSICVYLPRERILFGGCSVKALANRTLGNTADANIEEWPASLRAMKSAYPDALIVVPGHGAEGGLSLIDHTLSLF